MWEVVCLFFFLLMLFFNNSFYSVSFSSHQIKTLQNAVKKEVHAEDNIYIENNLYAMNQDPVVLFESLRPWLQKTEHIRRLLDSKTIFLFQFHLAFQHVSDTG